MMPHTHTSLSLCQAQTFEKEERLIECEEELDLVSWTLHSYSNRENEQIREQLQTGVSDKD
jgi:hypothetical protein